MPNKFNISHSNIYWNGRFHFRKYRFSTEELDTERLKCQLLYTCYTNTQAVAEQMHQALTKEIASRKELLHRVAILSFYTYYTGEHEAYFPFPKYIAFRNHLPSVFDKEPRKEATLRFSIVNIGVRGTSRETIYTFNKSDGTFLEMITRA